MLGRIGARHVKRNTIGEKERAFHEIVRFVAVIALDALDGGVKLRVHVGKKLGMGGKSVRF